MKIANQLVCVGLSCLATMALATERGAGARALYYNPQTRTAIGTSAGPSGGTTEPPKSPQGRKAGVQRGGKPRQDKPGGEAGLGTASTAAATATGVKYYMELLGEQGQLLRVNSNRVFHSGERFRLKLESNVDGRLTMVQSHNGGPFQRLFPDPRVHAGSDRIQSRVITALPSESGWFRFDDQPGEIRLMVMVVPDPPPGGGRAPGPPQPGPASGGSLVASRDPASDAAAIAAVQQRGSRALVVEEDTSAVEPATYAVAIPQRRDDPGELAIEIRLRHER